MLKKIGSLFSLLLLFSFLFTYFTPYPASWLIKALFKGGVAVAPNNYAETAQQVTVTQKLTYPSIAKQNTLDILSPAGNERLPVIIWVHGGAFAAGDKSDITEYATQIARHGYHIVNMNYALAPRAKYPTPLLQLTEVYQFVVAHADTYSFDTSRVYFAGDSAGAQIVSQFANVQTNPVYAAQVGLEPVVPAASIRGLLLFCGPYDIQKLALLSDNKVVRFLLDRVAWGYIGERHWQASEVARLASPIDHASLAYPPVFITDGTVMTFTEHGLAFAEKLRSLGVHVDSKFYEGVELPHEYQFMMNLPEAVETLEALLAFLQKTDALAQKEKQALEAN